MKKAVKILSNALCVGMLCGVIGCDSSKTEDSGVGQVVLAQKQYVVYLEDGDNAVALDYNVYENGVLQENAKVSYVVEDSSIVKMNGQGKAEAVAVGKTNVTIQYKKATAVAEVSVVGRATAEQINTFDEKYVNLFGRVYTQDGNLCFDHPATAVETMIDGTSLSAEILVNAELYVWVIVDGERYKRVQLTPAQTTYTLVSGLPNGRHTVRIVNSSEGSLGQIRIASLSADAFYTAPEKSDFSIEFIGDSITAGFGSIGVKGEARTAKNSDACSTYAYYTAEKLGVDYSTIAVSGICVSADLWNTGINMEMVYSQQTVKNTAAYDFQKQPNVIVLNLGTNDAAYVDAHPNYATQFPHDYMRFLQYIRAKNPDAYIICLYGFTTTHSTINEGIKLAVEEMNDEKICYLKEEFKGDGSGVVGHPPAFAQKRWGNTLANYIQNMMYLK